MIPKREIKPWHRINVWQFAATNNLSKTLSMLLLIRGLFFRVMRKDGRQEFIHAYRVAQILIFHGVCDDEVLAAALSHDVFEEISFKLWTCIEKGFGEKVALYTWILSHGPEESIAFHFARIGEDFDTILIKLADRLHNLRNMTKNLNKYDFFTRKRLLNQIEETWEYVVPLAVRAAEITCNHREKIIEIHEEMLRSLADAEWALLDE